MKSPYKLKAAVVYKTTGLPFDKLTEMVSEEGVPEELLHSDPAPSQWSSWGLVADSFKHNGALTLLFKGSERILPSKVRDDHLTRTIAEFREMEGRGPSKKEFRVMRDNVEAELLPRAFIRHKHVAATLTRRGKLIAWVSSPKAGEGVVASVIRLLDHLGIEGDTKFANWDYQDLTAMLVKGPPGEWLVGKNGVLMCDEAALRIKAIDLESGDLMKRVEAEHYTVSELELLSDERSFTVTTTGVLKKLDFSVKDDAEGFDASLWMSITEVSSIADTLSVVDEI